MSNEEIQEAFKFLHQHESSLSLNQQDLVKSFLKYFNKHGMLSERQEKVLFELKKFQYQIKDADSVL